MPGGNYITAILTVNDVIKSPTLRATPTLRLYRAYAFGQLIRGYRAANAIALGDAVSESIKEIVERDVAITLTYGSDYKEQVQVVLDPLVRKKGGHLAIDDDLQHLAINDPVLPSMTGSFTPPPPDPSTIR